VAIEHYVTSLHDDAPYNVLVSKSDRGLLRYDAIDGERSFGHSEGFRQFFAVRNLVAQGGPRQLSPGLWDRIRRTNIGRWTAHLQAAGVPPQEIGRAVSKLRQVQEHGLDVILQPFSRRATAADY
jgi:hypothetical protein